MLHVLRYPSPTTAMSTTYPMSYKRKSEDSGPAATKRARRTRNKRGILKGMSEMPLDVLFMVSHPFPRRYTLLTQYSTDIRVS